MRQSIIKKNILSTILMVLASIITVQAEDKGQTKTQQVSIPGKIAAEPYQVVCDAFVFDISKSNEIKKLYTEARLEILSKMKIEPNSNPEIIDTAVGKSFSEITDRFKQKLAGKLSESEIRTIEPVLAHRSVTTIAELRALRYLQLLETQRSEIQPVSVNFVLAGIPGATMKPEDVQKKVQEEQTILLEKIYSILTPEQITAWNTQTAQIKKETGIHTLKTTETKEVKENKANPEKTKNTKSPAKRNNKTTKNSKKKTAEK